MRFVSLFSGIEAASVAWEQLGWEAVAFAEIEPFPCAVLAERFPNVPNLGDVTKINWEEVLGKYGAVDIVCGGSPCQSFSIAGGRESLDGESRLMFEYLRAVRELRPRWCVWENVPGVLNTRDDAFGFFLDQMDEGGYSTAWRVLDAQFFGVAQRRRRVWAVSANRDAFGDIAAGRAAAVLFERESVRGNTQSSREKRASLAAAAQGDIGEGRESIICASDATSNASVDFDVCGCMKVGGCTPYILSNGDDIVGPICARDSKGQGYEYEAEGKIICQEKPQVLKLRHTGSPNIGGGHGALIGEEVSFTLATNQDQTLFAPDADNYIVRRLTPTECERLQGFPDDWTLIPYRGKPAEECPDGPRYKALGNSWAVPCARWIGERIEMVEELAKE